MKNQKVMRPMMEEYVQEDNSSAQGSRPPQSFQRPQSHYDQNVSIKERLDYFLAKIFLFFSLKFFYF